MNLKKEIYIVLSAILLVISIFSSDDIVSPKSKVSGSSIKYDRTIKTEEGKPILVVRVIDGDTIELINSERLRYIGVDSPEEFDVRKPVQCFAREAARRNKELTEGKNIIFYKDVSTQDIYGRWLGFVYLEDGTFVNEAMIKEGYAFSYTYPPDISKTNIFLEAQRFARENNLGLWGTCDVNELSTGRLQTNPE